MTSSILTAPAKLHGYLAIEAAGTQRRRGVIVFHEGLGRRLAGLGFVAFAADMFGDRWQARDMEEARALMGNALHGLTNPSADGSIMRAALYERRANHRASMQRLLEEVFWGDR
jgi:dienelactone hydrolase